MENHLAIKIKNGLVGATFQVEIQAGLKVSEQNLNQFLSKARLLFTKSEILGPQSVLISISQAKMLLQRDITVYFVGVTEPDPLENITVSLDTRNLPAFESSCETLQKAIKQLENSNAIIKECKDAACTLIEPKITEKLRNSTTNLKQSFSQKPSVSGLIHCKHKKLNRLKKGQGKAWGSDNDVARHGKARNPSKPANVPASHLETLRNEIVHEQYRDVEELEAKLNNLSLLFNQNLSFLLTTRRKLKKKLDDVVTSYLASKCTSTAVLEEVDRRQQYQEYFVNTANYFRAILDELKQQENTRRAEFLHRNQLEAHSVDGMLDYLDFSLTVEPLELSLDRVPSKLHKEYDFTFLSPPKLANIYAEKQAEKLRKLKPFLEDPHLGKALLSPSFVPGAFVLFIVHKECNYHIAFGKDVYILLDKKAEVDYFKTEREFGKPVFVEILNITGIERADRMKNGPLFPEVMIPCYYQVVTPKPPANFVN